MRAMYASTISDYADFPLPDGGQGTLAQALGQKSYGKVYVMLGVNELSGAETDRQNFYADMDESSKAHSSRSSQNRMSPLRFQSS